MISHSKERRASSFFRRKRAPLFIPLKETQKGSLTHLLDLIFQLTSFDARAYRDSTLKRRLELRLRATCCRNIQEYMAFLQKCPEEAFNFKENLLIHVSRFWRDRSVFTYFERHVLPHWLDQLASQKRRLLRVWSVGCAAGQEPFTLAMILHRPAEQRGLRLRILATDISPQILERAKEAFYSPKELRYVPPSYRPIYFEQVRPGLFQVSPELQKLVSFRQHNLLQEEGPGLFDLIVCRNLLIFFKTEAQRLMINKIIHSLTKGGLLLLGRAERIDLNGHLELISRRFCLYRKIASSPEKIVNSPWREEK